MRNNKKRIIGFVCTSFDNVAGGLERQIIRTSESLNLKGYKIYIISFDNNSAKSFYQIPNQIEWLKCGNGLKPHTSAKKYQRLKQILHLRKTIKKYKITDIITFHHGIFPRVFLASFALKIIHIVSERNSLKNYDYIKLNKINLGFLSLFFANKITVQLKSYIKDYPFFLRKKIYVISNILKNPLEKYKAPDLNSNKVAMAGRLCAQKNFTPLLDQIKKSNSNEIEVSIAGEGGLRSFLEKEYNEQIKNSTLNLRGNIKNIDSFFSESAIFCFPSLWEGYPNSLVEALRMGLPIVTSKRMKYLTEFVENNVNGLILDDNDFLFEIKKLIVDKERLNFMSLQSHNKYIALCKRNPIKDWIKLIESNYQ
ncbi:Glycosyl transferase, group 1 [Prochlorococcus marinus subsp. pastoris str. CCMP1986]|uniref:Glycosyl transferase, group 1 n=1 Tax=Prochlorococcus marinus subsp. pastoris (strain CCMP1986 / NIES-2087 / MED4) TaxID=59919 RepID=Q7V0N5_PROMP|nr:glycosyltransferase [Prochlorococcus marinus]KGF87218.1 Glycosyl transferase [Prochlorococcus marinus str. EQPAC1]CAE19680.1 Glycosyl transferase, group 1 [Prochlorococcus marinus subsp. pastoris str. CCMP1986]